METAYRVAELLEEIARNADPFIVAKRQFQVMLGNVQIPGVAFMFQTDPQQNTATVTYLIPVDIAMKGVEGTPEEVIEWLSTGASDEVSVSLINLGGPRFAVKQVHQNAHLVSDLKELADRFHAEMWRRLQERSKPTI